MLWFCCCEGGVVCPHSCDFEDTYTLTDMWFEYFWSEIVPPFAVGAGCCDNLISADVNVNGIQAAPITLNKNNVSGVCCYQGIFEMTVYGTVTYSWSYSPPFGAPDEVYSTTIPFEVGVPAEINVTCNGSDWYHEISFCHFQIVCSTPIMTNDCEAAHTTVDVGLRCAGGNISYWTPIKALDLISPSDISGINFCAPSIWGCPDGIPHNAGLTDYNDAFLAEGSSTFCGIYTTEECSEQDPFPPCVTAYSMVNQGGFILFGRAAGATTGAPDFCFGEEYSSVQGCATHGKLIVFNPGNYT